MKISFDYDGTISEDFTGWLEVMKLMKSRGHECFVVTFRDEVLDWNDELSQIKGMGYPVYFTSGVAKKWWCAHFGPGVVDVWIDDKPETVLDNSRLSVNELVTWREGNVNSEYVV